MTPWQPFSRENVERVPDSALGVFQLARGPEGPAAYVGRADDELRERLLEHLDKGYTHFQWVQLPWVKETFEMQCRLFHHGGGVRRLDNREHPYPPEGKLWCCRVSSSSAAMCQL